MNETGSTAWGSAEHILCVRLDSMGDVLMTGPALRALRESAPGRSITLLTSPAGAEGAKLLPEVDRILTYSAPWMKIPDDHVNSRADLEMVRILEEERFDAAVIFTASNQNPLPAALLCYLAGIPLRLACCRENPYHLLTNWMKDGPTHRTDCHEVQRQLDLVQSIGAETSKKEMKIHVTEEVRSRAMDLLWKAGVDPDTRWIVVHPGASASSKRYPPRKLAEAAEKIALTRGCEIVFTGSAEEVELVESIRDDMTAHSHSLAGQLTLPELAAVIQESPLLLSNHTGPVHIAASVGTSVVDLYALSNPQQTPWGVPSKVLFYDVPDAYGYNNVPSTETVSPDEIVRAVSELLCETEEKPSVSLLARCLDEGDFLHPRLDD